MSEYIGRRIIPVHGGVWNGNKSYEELTIVLDEDSGDSYISRRAVPAGTAITDENYWMLHSLYSQQIADAVAQMEETAGRMDMLEQRLDANVTASTDADADYAAEVVDARVDDTGREHSSLGGNIRSLGKIRSFQNILDSWTREAGYINAEGTKNGSEKWYCWRYIPVSAEMVIVSGKFGYMGGNDDYYNIWSYDSRRNSLGGVFRAENAVDYDFCEVELPEGTAFISVTTSTACLGSSCVFLPTDARASKLLNNWASTWQEMHGAIAVSFSADSDAVSVEVLRNSHFYRRVEGDTYVYTALATDDSAELEFTPSGWWAVYWQESTDDDGNTTGVWVAEENSEWQYLFTSDRFVLAVMRGTYVFYTAPVLAYSGNSLTINGVEYGNLVGTVDTLLGFKNSLTHTAYLERYNGAGGFCIDTDAGTIQATETRILGIGDNGRIIWIYADEEAYAISGGALEVLAGDSPSMLVLGLEYTGLSSSKLNLYTTSEFQALGSTGYYIASFWKDCFFSPHMSPDLPIVYNGVEYQAGELFYTEENGSFIEEKYRKEFGAGTVYLASGQLMIDREDHTIQITGRTLGCPENARVIWMEVQDEAVEWKLTASVSSMSILAYDDDSKEINLYDQSQFKALGTNGYFIASFYKGQLYNAHMSPGYSVILDGTEYMAGALFFEDSVDYVPSAYRDAYDNDGISDIAIPKILHCMEGRQLSCYYDSLSRFENSENLYRFTYSTTSAGAAITRNELCWNYTPGADAVDFTMNAIRLSRATAQTQETKSITVKVNHPLSESLTKNVCICGDSLVDNKYLVQEVWDMLDADGDCVINHIGTRGGTGYEHEGRGSWTWAAFLQGDDYYNKSNAFWNTEDDCLDFQWYCGQNGYDSIDYMLIALGTNDISQGKTAYSTFELLSAIIENAKKFIDALLSEDRGYPNCRVGIGLIGPGSDYHYLISSSIYTFRKSANTLNQLYLKTFDNGAYHENVTCFSHGMMTNRKYAYPYSNEAISDRYEETSRTLTNSIHPTQRGYQAWADGYYNMIRGFLTEDAEAAESE